MAKGSGLDKKYELSPELADFMGKDEASRKEITKKLWNYIKKHDLNEGRTIHPDEELEPILGSKPFDMMKMALKISAHVIKD